jgi:quinol monooxygenase YgiN
MAIGVFAIVKVKPGKGRELEAIAKELMAVVRKNEPGNHYYQFFKSKIHEDNYVVMEIYDDDAAFKFHVNSDHFNILSPRLSSVVEGRPEVQFFEAL